MLLPVGYSAFAAAVGLLTGVLIMWLTGYDPGSAYGALYEGVFRNVFDGELGNEWGLYDTLGTAVPIMLTGLTFAIGIRGGVFNIGAEGQVYAGAVAAVAASLFVLPPGLHHAVAIAFGMLAGALWALPVSLLKVTRGVHEVISTIMLNRIGLFVGMYFVTEFLGNPEQAQQTISTAESAQFPAIMPGTSLTYAAIVPLVVAVLVFFFLWRTTFGYRIRVVGYNPYAARYAGMSESSTVNATFWLGGMAAGLAGALTIIGGPPSYALSADLSTVTDLGFDGIGVALIGRNHPIGIIFAALFFAALNVGGLTMQISSNVPQEIVQVIQGVIILILAAPELLRIARNLFNRRSSDTEEAPSS
ncbi:MAG: ABC transporter permease [Candidatus Bipolaricaulia bacterium]